MALLPSLRFGLYNGWIALARLGLVEGACFLLFPKDVVRRLFDRSGWSRNQVTFTVIGKLCALVCLVLLTFTPLKVGSTVFAVGTVVSALGLAGLATALVTYRNTPLDQPVEQGLYRISRHPQIVMASIVLLGATIAIGSWTAVLALVAARVFSHFGIVAEEQVCLSHYGDSYREYMRRVPRYLVFF